MQVGRSRRSPVDVEAEIEGRAFRVARPIHVKCINKKALERSRANFAKKV